MTTMPLKAPFPYAGGKSRVAAMVWDRFGDVRNYIEPFCGTAAMLLLRPHAPQIETVNDADCMIANFWRAVQAAPEAVVEHANWPVNEADLHSRHRYLVLSDDAVAFRKRMKTDPEYFDAKIAGWWVWGCCMWIGGSWCSSNGWGRKRDGDVCETVPQLGSSDGVLSKRPKLSGNGRGGPGVHRLSQQVPDLAGDGGAAGRGVHSSGMLAVGRPQLADQYSRGRGVHANDSADSIENRSRWLNDWFRKLQDRLRTVRVCCGDWSRVCSSVSVTTRIGITAVFLDPPYLGSIDGETNRDANIYAVEDLNVAHEVREWCLKNGENREMRIALCGLDGEHNDLEVHGWEKVAWKASGGYGNRNAENQNRDRERIWFSPHCPKPRKTQTLFAP
jgi:site-specific DNA-adenine methylase